MKQKLCFAFFIATLLFTTQLQAGYEQFLVREDPTGVFSYQNGDIDFESPPIVVEGLRSVTDKAEMIFFTETRLRHVVKQKTCALLAEYGLSCSQFRFDIKGPIIIELRGKADGTVEAKVGGFTVEYYAKGQNGFWLNAYLRVETSTIWLSGTYDVVSGDVSDLSIDDFSYNLEADVDFIGIRISADDFAESKLPFDIETEINAAVADAQSSLDEDSLFNLEQVIPTGTYIYEGVDYGLLAQNEVIEFLSDESLTLTLSRETVQYNENYSQFGQFFTQYHVNINISDHFGIHVTNQPVFNTTWVGCPFSQPFCEIEF